LFLSSDPEDLDQVGDDVNISVESNELKMIDSRPETNKNDIGNYLSNKLTTQVERYGPYMALFKDSTARISAPGVRSGYGPYRST
jgi:hypothetical protein